MLQNYQENNAQSIQVTGYVICTERDKRGQIVEIAISTETFERFTVVPNKVAEGLYQYLDKGVKVKGFISGEDIMGNKLLTISNFVILN